MVASGALNAMNSNPGYYQGLVKDFVDYPNPCFNQIELVGYLLNNRAVGRT